MKRFIPALALLPWLLIGATREPERGLVVFVGGDLGGYLSPCGCTKPMTGGIRRWATALRRESIPGRTYVLHNGGLVSGPGRQNELKLAAAAQMLGSVGVSALNLSLEDAQMGLGSIEQLSRLASEALFSSQIAPSAGVAWDAETRVGPFNIYAAAADPEPIAFQIQSRVRPFTIDPSRPGILLLQGDRQAAGRWAAEHPSLKLVVYSASSVSTNLEDQVGGTLLLSPGEHGKELLKLWWHGGEFKAMRVVPLGPEVKDDPQATSAFQTYLTRVVNEKLMDQMPRIETSGYIGSEACGKCHASEVESWKATRHAESLKSLEVPPRQDRDPECIGCHVVGIESASGFRSRQATPHLANVGCESCHGPGAQHQMSPSDHRMSARGERSCAPCHKLEHSPKFRFQDYWQKIAH